MSTDSRKILVTGATGHAGCEIVQELADLGRPTVATDLPGADWDALESLPVETRKADLLGPGSWSELLADVGQVVHTVGLIDISRPYEQLYEVNCAVTAGLLEAARDIGVEKVVLFSSASVCGLPSDGPIREDSAPVPKNDYEKTKLIAEGMAQKFAETMRPRVCVLRPSVIYGPRGRLLSPTTIVLASLLRERGWTVPRLTGGPRSNWVHVRDVARAAVFLLDRGENAGVYHVANDDPASLGEVVDLTFDALGVPAGRTLRFPKRLARFFARHPPPAFLFDLLNRHLKKRWERLSEKHSLPPGFDGAITPGIVDYGLGDYVFDNRRIKDLGFELEYPGFRTGWLETIDWYRENRWIP